MCYIKVGQWVNPVLNNPELLGRENRKHGLMIEKNPYRPIGSRYWLQWRAGWYLEGKHTLSEHIWASTVIWLLDMGLQPWQADEYARESADELFSHPGADNE